METKVAEQLRMQVQERRQQILADIELQRGSKVITLIHHREPWSYSDHPQAISLEDTEHVLMGIESTPSDRPIDLILHTPGGLALAAEMIALAVKRHPAPVTVFVPFYALSGGTLIALAADEILMAPYSVLGPVDPQIGGMPANALLRLLTKKPLAAIQDQMVILADVAEMALNGARSFVISLVGDRMSEGEAEALVNFMTGGYITHDTPIFGLVAQSLGLPVVLEIPREVYDLFATYEFGNVQRPSLPYCECLDPQGMPNHGNKINHGQ